MHQGHRVSVNAVAGTSTTSISAGSGGGMSSGNRTVCPIERWRSMNEAVSGSPRIESNAMIVVAERTGRSRSTKLQMASERPA